MGLHSRLPQGAAGRTPDVAQYHTMHSAQYLEDQATALLNAAAPKSRGRANSLASSSATDMFSTDSDVLSLWQQAAGIYSTDGDDGELSRPSSLKRVDQPAMLSEYAANAPFAKPA